MRAPRILAAVATLLVSVIGDGAVALDWHVTGHSRITYGVATRNTDFTISPEIARVMALASVAPDFFEFTHPEAHAQTHDPPSVDTRGLNSDDYERQRKEDFERSEVFVEFYFQASLAAMRTGDREKSAFLLGYALHNVQDFASHRGMPNIWHAWLNQQGKGPDEDPARQADATKLTALMLERFRANLTETRWRLFQGQTVRLADGQEIKPRPLSRLGALIDDWNPREGVIALVRRTRSPHFFVLDRALAMAERRLDQAGISGTRKPSKLTLVDSFVRVFFANQRNMLELLDTSGLGLLRGSGSPAEPKAVVNAVHFYKVATDFETKLPALFEALSDEDRAFIEAGDWRPLIEQRIARMRALRAARRDALSRAYSDEIARLEFQRARFKQKLLWLRVTRVEFNVAYPGWVGRSAAFEQLRPPRQPLHPVPPPARVSSTPASTPSRSSEIERRPHERERETKEIKRLKLPKTFGPGGFTW